MHTLQDRSIPILTLVDQDDNNTEEAPLPSSAYFPRGVMPTISKNDIRINTLLHDKHNQKATP